ncbi:TonB-dependent receptor plug domain-containing protein [Sphingobacterium sp. LRF_L2]|uniref:TonB-dependent receptor plug domain-containing protein n=1 Tax=Sphingobacterium sp. LRF_L2 TaxID=3369421 RepID=UPI003F61048A
MQANSRNLVYRYSILLGFILSFTIIFPLPKSYAQEQKKIIGHVVDEKGSPIPYASVSLNGISVVSTDRDGKFAIDIPRQGTINLHISALGMKPLKKVISQNSASTKIQTFTLVEDVVSIEAIEILGLSKVDQVNKQSFNVTAIDAKKLHNNTIDVTQLLNRVSGVRVRESGGLGSQTALSINGFSGNQVKIFMDGLPIDNYGSSFQLNNIPINYISQIEVYKGVVPIWLGGDAIGGAINLVKNTAISNFVDASYSYGSFGTHRANLNAGYIAKNGFTLELNAYKNYSKNNYWVNVDVVPDITTGVTISDRVRRFHDQYDNQLFNFNIGVSNKSWADQLLFGIKLGDNHADIQTGNRMSDVFGARFKEGNIILPNILYHKNNFLVDGLDLKVQGSFNLGEEKTVDTVYRQFNWYGESIPKGVKDWSPGGEVERTLYRYKNNNANATANLQYALNEHNTVYFNNTFTSTNRIGDNELQPDNDFYKQPKKLQKNITGLAWGNSLIENFVNQIFIKHYFQHVHAYQVNNGIYSDYEDTRNYFGYGIASSYNLSPLTQFKFSYEKTYRLPIDDELFGDVVNLTANPQLKPEHSHNYNLGVSHTFQWDEQNALLVNMSGIFRKAKDFIRYVNSATNNNGNMMQTAQNQRDVNNLGGDLELHYSYARKLHIVGNITYQNLRNQTEYETSSTDVSIFYKDRLPNIPYLFGNADVSYQWNNVLLHNSSLRVGANMYYVHDYFLRWPSAGTTSTKETIPEQLSYDANITYSFANGKYNIGIDARNITDAILYDNYMLQKPSRNFNVKFRYAFTKK